MKVVLSDSGLYELQQHDLDDLDSFERHAAEPDLFAGRDSDHEGRSYRWNELNRELALERFKARSRARLEELNAANAREVDAREQQGDQ